MAKKKSQHDDPELDDAKTNGLEEAMAQRIEIVTQMSGNGEVQTAEFDATATLQKSTTSGRSPRKVITENDDDALLF